MLLIKTNKNLGYVYFKLSISIGQQLFTLLVRTEFHHNILINSILGLLQKSHRHLLNNVSSLKFQRILIASSSMIALNLNHFL